jgi:uncharacterized protein (TIGR03435 family)
MIRKLVRSVRFATICWIGGASAALTLAQSQQPASAVFEVASVKQLERSLQPGQYDLSFVGTSGKPFKIAGNRVAATGTLHTLIADAYGVKDYQISAAPSWADSLLYAIIAKTPGEAEPTQDEVRPMLQALLAERFQLKFHRDSKELPVYHMVQAKKSNLFKMAAPNETFGWNVTPGPGGTMRSKATKESIGDFVQLVGVSTDRPVIDKTGITGEIDYDILISLPEGWSPEARNPEETNRAIVYAVVDQLGLKLESAKDRVEMLVVDRVEKPSAD